MKKQFFYFAIFRRIHLKKLLLLVSLLVSVSAYASNAMSLTQALNSEAKAHKNPNIIEQTHPVLFAMVKRLTCAAQVEMPRYIRWYDAAVQVGLGYGTHVVVGDKTDMTAWFDIMGDLNISREILTDLTYEQVEGILAVAISEKSQGSRAIKLALTAVGTFAAAVVCMSYPLNNGNEGVVGVCSLLAVLFPIISTRLVANNLQKNVDIKALKLTEGHNVIDGIKGLNRLEEAYIKEGVLARIAHAMKQTSIYNFLVYPMRAFNDEERIEYLQQKIGQ